MPGVDEHDRRCGLAGSRPWESASVRRETQGLVFCSFGAAGDLARRSGTAEAWIPGILLQVGGEVLSDGVAAAYVGHHNRTLHSPSVFSFYEAPDAF